MRLPPCKLGVQSWVASCSLAGVCCLGKRFPPQPFHGGPVAQQRQEEDLALHEQSKHELSCLPTTSFDYYKLTSKYTQTNRVGP